MPCVLQELNNRLTDEIMKIRSCFSGQTDLSPLTHGKDLYELEVQSKAPLAMCVCVRWRPTAQSL